MIPSVYLKSLAGGLLAKFASPITRSVNQAVRYKQRSAWQLFNPTKTEKKKKTKLKKQESYILESECSPNWELLGIEDNRFFLPRMMGLAWQDALSIIDMEDPLDGLVEFKNKDAYLERMQMCIIRCPDLLQFSLESLFPSVENIPIQSFTLIELVYQGQEELGPNIFVLAAHQVTKRLRAEGFWADFINPFSGQPFHDEELVTDLYEEDEKAAGHHLKVSIISECLVLTKNKSDDTFGGSVFSNAPPDPEELAEILVGFEIFTEQ